MCPKKYKEPEFAKPKSRAKATEKQYRRRSRIQVLEVKQQRPRTISTSDDDNSDSSTSQFKRKRVESPIRDCPAEIKPCDCGGDSSNHMIFYERNDGPLKRHKCIGSKADTQKHAGCELYTNNEYNKRMKELNAFESKYAGEVDLKQHPLASEKGTKTLTAKENKITRCECGEDATITHFLYNKEKPECKTRCLGSIKLTESHYTYPLITKQQRTSNK
ncbi:hypothetical protein JTB14_035621 [Gonioctena quinquepunctata]|nr:hypothetical protein JTB14_035621 [Gonioctena quinquepunctata]